MKSNFRNLFFYGFGFFFLSLILSCESINKLQNLQTEKIETLSIPQITGSAEKRTRYEITGTDFVIATDHPLASEAGVRVYKEGGNVVDAFTAASFVLAVVRPQSTGLLGGGFAIVNLSDTRVKKAFDFRERAPKKANSKFYLDNEGKPIPGKTSAGAYSAGIPGNIQGILLIQKKYGKLSLEKVLNPAVTAARRGISIYSDLDIAISSAWPKMNLPMKKVFGIENRPLREGELLVQEDLAKTIERIILESEKEVSQGETAKKIVSYYSNFEEFINEEDLKTYTVHELDPLLTQMFGSDVLMMPPPSSSVFLGTIANVYSELRLKKTFPMGEVGEVIRLTESMRVGYRDRASLGGDPSFTNVPVAELLSTSYAKKEANEIVKKVVAGSLSDSRNFFTPKDSYNTTHISVLDNEGNAVSSTQSVNGIFGAGLMVPETGLVLNNTMDDFSVAPGVPNIYGLVGSEANSIVPGKTPLSSMSPLVFIDSKGSATLVIGAPGGSQIPTSIFNTLYHYLVKKHSLYESVSYPRIHHQFKPDFLYVDPEYKPTFPESELPFYKVQYQRHRAKVFVVSKEGARLVGVSDSKGEGIPLGF